MTTPPITSHPFLPMVSITTSAGQSIPPWLLKSVIVGYNEKQLGTQLSIQRWVNSQRPKQLNVTAGTSCGGKHVDMLWTFYELMLCLTLSCWSTWAPTERRGCTTSVWPLSLARMSAVLPSCGTKWDKAVIITVVNMKSDNWRLLEATNHVKHLIISLLKGS